jgi:hypothetical protein
VQLQAPGGSQSPEAHARQLGELIQKIYLGVGVVLTADEAREIVNEAGGSLSGSLPAKTPAVPPAA